jgi:hypothetical protein
MGREDPTSQEMGRTSLNFRPSILFFSFTIIRRTVSRSSFSKYLPDLRTLAGSSQIVVEGRQNFHIRSWRSIFPGMVKGLGHRGNRGGHRAVNSSFTGVPATFFSWGHQLR